MGTRAVHVDLVTPCTFVDRYKRFGGAEVLSMCMKMAMISYNQMRSYDFPLNTDEEQSVRTAGCHVQN
jgi:hypothetical protein